jgi:hypothetical protein
VRQREIAASGHAVAVAGDDLGRPGVVGNEVQHGDHQHGDRSGEVDQAGHVGVFDDLVGLAQVGADRAGVRVAGEDRLPVRDGDRVDVDVDDARVGRAALGHVVHVAQRRYPGADIEELPDPGVGEPLHDPAQVGAVGVRDQPDVGPHLDGPVEEHPVDLEVVGTAQREVVHPGRVRHRDVDVVGHPSRPFHRTSIDVRGRARRMLAADIRQLSMRMCEHRTRRDPGPHRVLIQ